eukprot:9531419-Alexandrium_andersonii.AAC.1
MVTSRPSADNIVMAHTAHRQASRGAPEPKCLPGEDMQHATPDLPEAQPLHSAGHWLCQEINEARVDQPSLGKARHRAGSPRAPDDIRRPRAPA